LNFNFNFVGKSPQEIASFLCSEAIRKRSEDNVTVILTKIEWITEDEAVAQSVLLELLIIIILLYLLFIHVV
jgi:hypothetical protein